MECENIIAGYNRKLLSRCQKHNRILLLNIFRLGESPVVSACAVDIHAQNLKLRLARHQNEVDFKVSIS